MLTFRHCCVLIIIGFSRDVLGGHRRIFGGKIITSDKPYMVYFLSSNLSKINHDSWLCGGAIVSPRKILTSAACLVEINHLYVIAGYKKYVNHMEIENDPCTRLWKQKVIQICVPKAYNFKYEDNQMWSHLDIGVAIVEKPYNFSDVSYRLHCSYIPAPIRINYEMKYQMPKISAVVYGWGTSHFRSQNDIGDRNSEYLQEATTRIIEKSVCQSMYNFAISDLIQKYFICASGSGIIDGDGNLLEIGKTDNERCSRRSGDTPSGGCLKNLNKNIIGRNTNASEPLDLKASKTRREGGICQNDHGGPLVTWVGSELTVIGVATGTVYKSNYVCSGPFLFTSTYCTGSILQCMLNSDPDNRRRCSDQVKQDGFDIQQTSVNWHDKE